MQKLMTGITGIALAATLAAGAASAGAMPQVTGSAGYRERIALPPEAVLSVELLDVSKMDVAATVMSSQRFRLDGVPQDFALAYDPALIDDRMSYVLSARIEVGGKVVFRTTEAYPVLTRDAGDHADLILVSSKSDTQAAGAVRWTGRWQVIAVGARAVEVETLPVIDLNDSSRMGLKGACNSYVGETDPNGSNLRFKKGMAGTLMACSPEAEQLDRDIIAALEATDRYEVDGDEMQFLDADGAPVLKLRRLPE